MLKAKSLLTPLQRAFLRVLADQVDQAQLHLAGGTALAEFHLGHRLPSDLAFLTTEIDLILPVSHQIEAASSQAGLQIEIDKCFAAFGEFSLPHDGQRLRVTLALDAQAQLDPPVLSEYGVLVASYVDLCTQTLLAYYRAPEPSAAVDLHFLLQEEALDPLLGLAGEKDASFDLYWLAVALSRAADFPDQLDRWPERMLATLDPADLSQSFQRLAYDLMFRITGPADTPPHP